MSAREQYDYAYWAYRYINRELQNGITNYDDLRDAAKALHFLETYRHAAKVMKQYENGKIDSGTHYRGQYLFDFQRLYQNAVVRWKRRKVRE